jgi:Zn-finger domain-containing protein
MGKTWIAETDVDLLLLTCKQLDRQILLDSILQEDQKDFHVMRQLLELEKEIVTNLGKLGMTVDSRARLGLAEIKAQSAFEKLMAERAQ